MTQTTELPDIGSSILAIRDVSQVKREMLWRRAARQTKTYRRLHLGSGGLALLSGGAITSLISDIGSPLFVKIAAAILAFSSGLMSLLTTTLHDSKETERMFEGAVKYALLRDNAQTLFDRQTTISAAQLLEGLKQLRAESGKLTKDYDKMLPMVESRLVGPRGQAMMMGLGDERC